MNFSKRIALASLVLLCTVQLPAEEAPKHSVNCFKLPQSYVGKALLALSPFIFYLYYKNPQEGKPEPRYTLDPTDKRFWTLENLKFLIDDGLVGQRLKLKSVYVGDEGDKLAFRKKDCLPTGILGNADSYLQLGGKTGKTLKKLLSIIEAVNVLEAFFAIV